ncbi:MAG TPA: hypothetical protein PLJ21_01320 [Pseudobdellovibrionaceae bacterium]|nr:hypothetical protein [Pseudobdellovibrionaceae bacterium]
MRELILIFSVILSMTCHAHDGHGGHGEILNGELTGLDGIRYLDAGASTDWANQKLLRKVNNNNQIVYQYIGAAPDKLDASKKEMNLKIPGGEKLKGYSFNHAGEFPDSLSVIMPSMASQFEISKHSDFTVLWSSAKPASVIRIIIEVTSDLDELKGRLTISTNDDGEFIIPSALLAKLPNGKSKFAFKRIWIGGFHPEMDNNKVIGVRTSSSIVGKAIVVD